MKKSRIVKIIKEEINKVLKEQRGFDDAFGDLDREMANYDKSGSPQRTSSTATSPSTSNPPAEPKDASPLPRGKCQGEQFTKECAIAYLREAIPLDKLPSNRANMEKREDAMTRHNVLQKKSGTSKSTGEKMYKVNGILVKASEIK